MSYNHTDDSYAETSLHHVEVLGCQTSRGKRGIRRVEIRTTWRMTRQQYTYYNGRSATYGVERMSHAAQTTVRIGISNAAVAVLSSKVTQGKAYES